MTPVAEHVLESRLEQRFSGLLADWPESERQCLKQLVAQIWPYARQLAVPGIETFTTLTKLYPAFQANGLVNCSEHSIDTALAAHLCLLLHAFISDRNDDGQIHLDSIGLRAVTRLHDEGLHLLRELRPEGASAPELRRVFESVEQDTGEFVYGAVETRLTEAADFSARLGFLATACHLAYAGAPPQHLRLAATAYRHIVVALQYVDDMQDWKEDRRLGNRNLLLGYLEDRACTLPEPSSSDIQELLVSQMLLRHRAHEVAGHRAIDRLRAARSIEQQLGCAMLDEKLSHMIFEIEARLPKLIRDLENEVIVGYLLAPSVSRRS